MMQTSTMFIMKYVSYKAQQTYKSFLKQRLVCSQETNDADFYNVYNEIRKL